MKLVSRDLPCLIEWKENQIEVLVVESPKFFSEIVCQIRKGCDGEDTDWILSKEGNPVNMSKKALMIIDPFFMDLNQKKLLNALYSDIENMTLASERVLQWNEFVSELEKQIDFLTQDVEYSLDYDMEITVRDFLKLMNLRFRPEGETFLEYLSDVIAVFSEVLTIDLFIFVNLFSYLDKEERRQLYEVANYKKVSLLILEAQDRYEYLREEHVVIIDKDLCVIEPSVL